jgi:hypothetical protein
MTQKKLGIVQSRGLGDIVIALPIARHYHDEGYQIHWPICREFISNFEHTVPWITWHPVTTDQGSFFLEQPMKVLGDLDCDEIMPLYQALTGQNYHEAIWFQHTKFDQYKYIRAGVPFRNKWRLADCITRQPDREQQLLTAVRQQLPNGPDEPYCLVHLDGSDHRADFDQTIIPEGMSVVELTAASDSIWDWLSVIQSAHAVILVDSVYSNIVEQMTLLDDDSRYFIPRSHIGLTPVQINHWNWLTNRALNPSSKTIQVK